MKTQLFILITIISIMISTGKSYSCEDLTRLLNLEGKWKFSIGDSKKWIAPDYDDSNWESITVPSPWEDEGYNGYDGYAWYRKSFYINSDLKKESLYLVLCYIDDVDQVFINGQLVGITGSMPPEYSTAYNAFRKYSIPKNVLNFDGKNTIAVRIFDEGGPGGIVDGEVGIFADKDAIPLDFDLQGTWKFSTGDNSNWKDVSYNDQNWENMIVPSEWENQGYKDYDGFAWYRKTFKVGEQFKNQRTVLILGKIDDFDEVYINGKRIGKFQFTKIHYKDIHSQYDYDDVRIYYLIEDDLLTDQDNTIAIRVYDSGGRGGMYEGQVGIANQTKFVKFWRNKEDQPF